MFYLRLDDRKQQVINKRVSEDIVLDPPPAGEKHWHGATKDSEFSHIVVTRVGAKLTQVED